MQVSAHDSRCSLVTLWDHQAKRGLVAVIPRSLAYYVGNSYRKAVEIGLRYVGSHIAKITLLKTDLWNEGIETQRNVFGEFQGDSEFELYGVDVSGIVCYYARKRLGNAHILQANIANLPFKDKSFDVVLDLSTLDHIQASGVPQVIREYGRLQRRGGVIVLVHCYRSVLSRLAHAVQRLVCRKKDEGVLQFYHDPKSVGHEMEKYFDTVEQFYVLTLLAAPFDLLKKIPIRICRSLIDLEYSWISKYLLGNLGSMQALVARKR